VKTTRGSKWSTPTVSRKTRVRPQRGAVDAAYPAGIRAAHDRTRHERINISVGQTMNPARSAGYDLVFQPIYEIRWRRTRFGSLGPGCCPPFARRIPSPARGERVMPVSTTHVPSSSSHGFSKVDLACSGRPSSVPSMTTLICRRGLQGRISGQNRSVCFSHALHPQFSGLSRFALTICPRTCACWISIGSVASTTVRPNSGSHFFSSYSDKMRPWNMRKPLFNRVVSQIHGPIPGS